MATLVVVILPSATGSYVLLDVTKGKAGHTWFSSIGTVDTASDSHAIHEMWFAPLAHLMST